MPNIPLSGVRVRGVLKYVWSLESDEEEEVGGALRDI
jgi:hypothetical protein